MAENTIQKTNAVATTGDATPATREDARYLIPAVDIFETDKGLTLIADVPGVEDKGLDVRVENDLLTIRGRITQGVREDSTWREFELVDYYRQFQLNDKVDHEKISAKLADGVLTLDLPRPAKAQPRRIEVKGA